MLHSQSHRPASSCLLALALAGMPGLGSPARAQLAYEWAAPLDGRFEVEANWSPLGLPGPTDTAILGGFGPYVVTIDGLPPGSPSLHPRVEVLDLANPEAVALLISKNRFGVSTLRGAGEFHVAAPPRGAETTLAVAGGGEIAGTVRLFRTGRTPSAGRIINASPDAPVEITRHGLVTGSGDVEGDFVNRGVLESSGEFPVLNLRGSFTQLDGGTIRGAPGAPANISVAANLLGGRVELLEGGRLDANGSLLSGVTIDAGHDVGASFDAVHATLRDCVMLGHWGMREGRQFNIEGLLAGDATIVVNDDGGTATTTIRLYGDASLGIRVVLNGATTAGFAQFRDGVGTISSRGVVTGRGGLYGRIHNEGVIEASGADGFISFGPTAVITQADTGEVRSTGGLISLTTADVRGGRWVSGYGVDAGIVKGGTISDAVFSGQWNIVEGTSATLAGEIASDPVAPGVLLVNSGGADRLTILWMIPAAVMNAAIDLKAPDGSPASAASVRVRGVGEAVRIGPAGVVRGQGLLRFGGFMNEGVLSPNGQTGLRSPGVIEVSDATLECLPGSRVVIDVAGPESSMHDRIAGSGDVSLDGALEIRFAESYQPAASDRYEVVRATSVEGRFAGIEVEVAGAVGEVGPAHVVYSGDAATLVLCAADRTGDGVLDVFDFLAFQDQFMAGDLQADLDGDGRLTILDILVFQDRFVRGC